ncbi:MAG: T9SS type A sorting domain-containing protein [Ignavibacteriales bacterium]|nr:MAG: T9SS type A sorting domain-containing protein [Ignavibacteriales bacterium]
MILLFAVAWWYLAIPINAQWMRVQGIIPFNVTVRSFVSYSNESGERILFAGTEGAGVFRSTDDGLNWIAVNTGLSDYQVYSLVISDTTIFAGTDTGVFRSSIKTINWSEANKGMTGFEIYSFAISGSDIYAGAFWGGVFRSTNNGNTWISTGLHYVLSLLSSGEYLFAGDAAGQVWRSTDNGSSWLPSISGLLYTTYNALAMTSEGNLFAGSYLDSSGVFLSTDNGINWIQFDNGLTNKEVYTFAVSGSNLFAGTFGFDGGVFYLTNIGSSWVPFNEGFNFGPHVCSPQISGNYIFAGTLNGLWRRPLSDIIPVELTSFTATNKNNTIDLNWVTSSETNNRGFEVQRSNDEDFESIGFVEGNGTTIESKSYSYIDREVATGKYKYRLKQIDYDGTFEYSKVVEVEVSSPSTFSLEQNYPNPFNPTTKIIFNLAVESIVSFKIFDILGQEIMSVPNKNYSSGSHTMSLDGSSLNSGVYFYRIDAAGVNGKEFISVKKMILAR